MFTQIRFDVAVRAVWAVRLVSPSDRLARGVSMLRRLRTLVATLVITLLSALAAAQEGPGTLAVVVRDSSGGALPGATIRIVNEGSSAAVDAVSDEQGSYTGTGGRRTTGTSSDCP